MVSGNLGDPREDGRSVSSLESSRYGNRKDVRV